LLKQQLVPDLRVVHSTVYYGVLKQSIRNLHITVKYIN